MREPCHKGDRPQGRDSPPVLKIDAAEVESMARRNHLFQTFDWRFI